MPLALCTCVTQRPAPPPVPPPIISPFFVCLQDCSLSERVAKLFEPWGFVLGSFELPARGM